MTRGELKFFHLESVKKIWPDFLSDEVLSELAEPIVDTACDKTNEYVQQAAAVLFRAVTNGVDVPTKDELASCAYYYTTYLDLEAVRRKINRLDGAPSLESDREKVGSDVLILEKLKELRDFFNSSEAIFSSHTNNNGQREFIVRIEDFPFEIRPRRQLTQNNANEIDYHIISDAAAATDAAGLKIQSCPNAIEEICKLSISKNSVPPEYSSDGLVLYKSPDSVWDDFCNANTILIVSTGKTPEPDDVVLAGAHCHLFLYRFRNINGKSAIFSPATGITHTFEEINPIIGVVVGKVKIEWDTDLTFDSICADCN